MRISLLIRKRVPFLNRRTSSRLDYTFFPHLIELILSHCEVDQLISLRLICKRFLTHIEESLASHIVVTDLEASNPFHSVAGHTLPWSDNKWGGIFPEEGGGRFTLELMRRRTQILDLYSVQTPNCPQEVSSDGARQASRLLLLTKLGLKTVRRYRCGDILIGARQLIDFGPMGATHPTARRHVVHGLRALPTFDNADKWMNRDGLDELVLIFDHDVHINIDDITKLLVADDIAQSLSLMGIVFLLKSISVTFVKSAGASSETTTQFKRSVVPPWLLDAYEGGCISPRRAVPIIQLDVRILSHCQYRELVGAKQYALETTAPSIRLRWPAVPVKKQRRYAVYGMNSMPRIGPSRYSQRTTSLPSPRL